MLDDATTGRGRGAWSRRFGTHLGPALLSVAALLPCEAAPQEPLAGQLRDRLNDDAVSFGALFQFVADFQAERTFPGSNGFSVANLRFNVGGRLDRGFSYFFQTSFGSVLDARLSYQASSVLGLDVGRFKSPFSAEFLIPASSIDLVNRSQSVAALVPGREVGVQMTLEGGSGLALKTGLFNASGDVDGNEDGRFHTVARIEWNGATSGGTHDLQLGFSAAHNADEITLVDPRDPARERPRFDNLGSLLGADVRWSSATWLLTAEVLRGRSTGADIEPERNPWGGQATIGYMLKPKVQALVRFDRFDADAVVEATDLLLLGLNYWPTSLTEVQVNLIQPVQGYGSEPQLLVNLQVSF